MSTALAISPAPSRRPGPKRRRPYPRNGWTWPGYDGTLAAYHRRRGVGTIVFPEPADGWSPLCIRLVELACALAIGDLPYPVREWAGQVPGLQRDGLMVAADQLLNDDRRDEIPFADVLAALAEAHRFVGFKN